MLNNVFKIYLTKTKLLNLHIIIIDIINWNHITMELYRKLKLSNDVLILMKLLWSLYTRNTSTLLVI